MVGSGRGHKWLAGLKIVLRVYVLPLSRINLPLPRMPEAQDAVMRSPPRQYRKTSKPRLFEQPIHPQHPIRRSPVRGGRRPAPRVKNSGNTTLLLGRQLPLLHVRQWDLEITVNGIEDITDGHALRVACLDDPVLGEDLGADVQGEDGGDSGVLEELALQLVERHVGVCNALHGDRGLTHVPQEVAPQWERDIRIGEL